MNKIRNVEIKNNILYFEYAPENSEEYGVIEWNIKENKEVRFVPAKYDIPFEDRYANKALGFLLGLYKKHKKLNERYDQVWC